MESWFNLYHVGKEVIPAVMCSEFITKYIMLIAISVAIQQLAVGKGLTISGTFCMRRAKKFFLNGLKFKYLGMTVTNQFTSWKSMQLLFSSESFIFLCPF
jgi:putative Mn2+ efflux pump MntP